MFDPQDIELWGGFRNEPDISGRTRTNIDNRGCPPVGAAAAAGWSASTSPMDDGSSIAVRKVPLATDPLLPNGRSLGSWSDREWLIDPAGFTAVAPTLRTPIAGPTPSLDIFGVRVVQTRGTDDRARRGVERRPRCHRAGLGQRADPFAVHPAVRPDARQR